MPQTTLIYLITAYTFTINLHIQFRSLSPRFISRLVSSSDSNGSISGTMFKFLVSVHEGHFWLVITRNWKLHNRRLSFQFSFGLGVYAGIYLSQNYDVPRVDEPAKVLDKVKEFMDDHKKK